ncbi:hypothetical protein [Flavobacterium sp.]|uniref:hypothetical protein n=1 Tax=Flavobacterium sp. TaxID=239 RepID=UPI002622A662|nr:hypothetical protein [Flavobacterium sp.]
MLKVNSLREFIVEIKALIPEIKYAQAIISNKEFVKFLEERKSSDNIMMFAVIPDHKPFGREDATEYTNYLQFFFLNKSPTKDLKHDQKLEIFDNVQTTVQTFIDLLLDAKAGDVEELSNCGLLSKLDESSIEIKAFFDDVQCRGYEVFFDIIT